MRLTNHGHNQWGNLPLQFNVETSGEIVAVRDLVLRSFGGGDDICYLQVPYFEISQFEVFPHGFNSPSIPLVDWGDNEEGDEDLDPRRAVVVFDLVFEGYDLEEDLANEEYDGDLDLDPYRKDRSGWFIHCEEDRAILEVSKWLDTAIPPDKGD
jgi:hypothetical protein